MRWLIALLLACDVSYFGSRATPTVRDLFAAVVVLLVGLSKGRG